MKILLITLALAGSLVAGGLNWVSSFSTAVKLAKQKHKPIMVYVEAEHCPWCTKMREEVLEEKDTVRVLNRDFILVKLDIDGHDASKYFPNTSMTPTIYFINSDSKPLFMIGGYVNSYSFYSYLSDVDKKIEELKGK